VDWESSDNRSELRIPVSDLTAPLVDYAGWHTQSAVFTRRGKYRILLAENLETENERGFVASCEVFFEGTAHYR
jgi:hypothetical protein